MSNYKKIGESDDKEELIALKAEVKSLNRKVIKYAAIIQELQKRMDLHEPSKFEDMFNDIAEDSQRMHKRNSLLIIQTAVLSECDFHLKSYGDDRRATVLFNITKAMDDKPEEWWKVREGKTLDQLCTEFYTLY